jgi:hypothetical protein
MPSTPVRPVKDPRARRLLISLSWVILQAAILIALAYACAMTAALLAAGAFGGHGTGPAVTVGMLGGITAALVVNHRARGWLMRLRLGRLRVRGVQAKAVVVKCDWDMSTGRGVAIARYTVLVRWVDPATGVPWQGDRGYRFAGLGSRRFEAACAHGAIVPVYYPPNRPSRFIIDVPFAPVMTDIVPLLPAHRNPPAVAISSDREPSAVRRALGILHWGLEGEGCRASTTDQPRTCSFTEPPRDPRLLPVACVRPRRPAPAWSSRHRRPALQEAAISLSKAAQNANFFLASAAGPAERPSARRRSLPSVGGLCVTSTSSASGGRGGGGS